MLYLTFGEEKGSAYYKFLLCVLLSQLLMDCFLPVGGRGSDYLPSTQLVQERLLNDCAIFSYSPEDDINDDDDGAIWNRNYFFFNKQRKRVCYVYLRWIPIMSHDDGKIMAMWEDDDAKIKYMSTIRMSAQNFPVLLPEKAGIVVDLKYMRAMLEKLDIPRRYSSQMMKDMCEKMDGTKCACTTFSAGITWHRKLFFPADFQGSSGASSASRGILASVTAARIAVAPPRPYALTKGCSELTHKFFLSPSFLYA
ncbi:hypothetical protein TSTA_123920 [Talaromyces stipitatus ATCC 10500]|uniref:Uncharacterized protein n=1 Tax=Talaromyces stipitatus (strain ATCC 10500 / CBS 375.48 / QM 6759 / NRRL 1006) TaxID=441959 RepID=B8MAG2_TALSN|nr:uncharacterized protein TSTA_123920 [Talaromyces stipitatus ATCC 10500]EED18664.1 hypothetical protein TSTA_123920 [Talaromyces stipitatus ATCC 10500]